jgi:hypothetical protein
MTKPRISRPYSDNQFYVKLQNTEQEGDWIFVKVLGFVQGQGTFPIYSGEAALDTLVLPFGFVLLKVRLIHCY